MTGLPAPTVQWTWRGLPLQETEGREGKGKKTWYDEKTGRVVLLIQDLGPGDEGDYQCRADNPYGDSTCTITVGSSQLTRATAILALIQLSNSTYCTGMFSYQLAVSFD